MSNLQTKRVLDDIVAHKTQELITRKQQRPLAEFEKEIEVLSPPAPLEAAFLNSNKQVKCILEIKPASPSAGVLKQSLDLDKILENYTEFGVGISVLTDHQYFGGSLELLSQVAGRVSVPVLCKDFIIDPYQVFEARHAGAQAVLLIVKALSDSQLSALFSLTRQLGMTPLVEIQDDDELSRALQISPSMLLINNRNLQSLDIDLATTEQLAPKVPAGILKVSASGIESRQDINRLKSCCDGFLIGSLLMRQPSPEHLKTILRELTQ